MSRTRSDSGRLLAFAVPPVLGSRRWCPRRRQDRPSVAIIGTRGYPSYYGGFETLVRHLVPFLAERGWHIDVYNRDAASVPEHPPQGVTVFRSRGTDTKSLSTLTHGLSSTAHAVFRRPDVALVCNPANGFWLPLLRLRRIPTAVNVDGIEWERDKWGRLARLVFRWGARACALFADRLIFDAEAIGARWATMFRRGGTFVPYGGTIERPELPAELNLPAGGYVLYVARLVPENSVLEFVQAARAVAREHPVVIVGSSGYGGHIEEHVSALARDEERVTWLGHISDDRVLHALWANAGVYFHGHTVGGTNPALVQAMACGAPTVARDTVFNREVLGPAGTYVSGDAANIAAEITRLLTDEDRRRRFGSAGVQRVEEYYTWERVCVGYEQALRELIRPPTRGPVPATSVRISPTGAE